MSLFLQGKKDLTPEIKKGILVQILRQAGLSREEFLKLL